MTKLRKIILIPALTIVSLSGFFSCGVDRWPEYAHQTALDTWILDIMQQNYLWYQELPSYDDVNLFVEPASFLSKVKSKQDSYSFVDSVMATPLPTYGFDYSLVRNPDIDTAYNALITYVIPGSPAAQAGLERGDWIMKVDTSYISKKYETYLLQGTKAVKLTLGEWKEVEIEDEEDGNEGGDGEDEGPTMEYRVVPIDDPVEMPAAQIVEDNPVHKYEIIESPVKKIRLGYLMDCVQLLGTILTSADRLGEPMAYLEYNDKNTDKDATILFGTDREINLNLHSLIAITSGTTMGAPEMLIRSLFLEDTYPIATVGSSTKGQNVATEQFINEEFLWSVNPVVCTVYNSQHDTYGAISPATDLKVSETTIDGSTNYSEFLPFGTFDKDGKSERLLKIAIGVLDGTYPPKDDETPEESTPQTRFKVEKSVSSPASRRFSSKGLRL